ncbi:RecX family transcriptional regulator [bacterium]|nr:RecX family transcriptional regulator [bacterium]
MSHHITQIVQAIKNTERVNLFLDNRFWISLSKNDLIKLRLTTGCELTQLEKEEIESTSVKGKLLEKAIRFTQLRPRSSSEVREYLTLRNKIDGDEAEHIISSLKEKEILNDEKFAHWYIDYKLGSGVHGVNKIKTELFKKRVDKKIIDIVLEKLTKQEGFKDDQLTKLEEFARKILPTIKAKDHYDRKSKLISRLLSRGFIYANIKEVLKKLL